MKLDNFTVKKQIDAKASVDFSEYLKHDPPCFLKYMNYVKSLEFTQKPDYNYMCSLF